MSNYKSVKWSKKAFCTYDKHIKHASHKNAKHKKSCPFGRHCFTDSGICGYIGYYLECPPTLEDRIYSEIREGVYEGIYPHTLFKVLRVARS
uniref:Uncharacterized protein n=1 Tax=Saccharolobus islandicus TaxID=43080 RepID=Q9P9J6_SACIS|nr:hypothetical protein [Sulfolobus islandicus]CAB81818.1 hypothetical protein [Sulfolobus islandicus]